MKTTFEGRFVTRFALLIVMVFTVTGCGIQIPADPRETLDRVTGGVLRVGASISDGVVLERNGELSGSEVDLIQGFADSRSATTDWTIASEETLVGMLEDGDIDVAIGGMTDETPWTERVGVTRGYPELPGADGRSLVLLVPLGENAFLTALETYLDEAVTR